MNELWNILDENGNINGRLHERGKPMQKGDYHFVVQVWIMNSKGEFLISRRTIGGGWWDGMWQTTGGCAVAGDDSIKTTLKETREEIGIMLDPINGQRFKRYSEHKNDDGNCFIDVWLFRQEVDILTVVFQPKETCDAMWASKEQIKQLIYDGVSLPIRTLMSLR